MIAIQHEKFEILWKEHLLKNGLSKKYFYGNVNKASHILAWVGQININKWRKIDDCEFVKRQLERMDSKQLKKIIDEERQSNPYAAVRIRGTYSGYGHA